MKIPLWPLKDPAERQQATFDFEPALVKNETILSASIDVTVKYGTDSQPFLIKDGQPDIGNSKVKQWLTGGVTDTIYNVRCTAKMSTGKVLVLAAYLPVQTVV